jgi:surface antigen
MKHLLAIAVLGVSLATVTTSNVSAMNVLGGEKNTSISNLFQLNLTKPFVLQPAEPIVATDIDIPKAEEKTQPEEKKTEIEKPKVVEYTVESGDSLWKISEKFSVTWVRIWQKNTNLSNQDVINVGDKLIIPNADEVLEDRPLFIPVAPIIAPQTSSGVATTAPVRQAPVSSYQNGGNTYDFGYCTWYVKNRRPDLPNQLGNANTWYARAQGYGLATGTEARAGAVGTTTRGALGHVVYVEAVLGGGKIRISEMNAPTWGETTSRTANESEFVYIY